MVKKECRNFKQKLKHWYRLNNSVDFIETYFYKKFEIWGIDRFYEEEDKNLLEAINWLEEHKKPYNNYYSSEALFPIDSTHPLNVLPYIQLETDDTYKPEIVKYPNVQYYIWVLKYKYRFRFKKYYFTKKITYELPIDIICPIKRQRKHKINKFERRWFNKSLRRKLYNSDVLPNSYKKF